jgi:hypothetical protein
MRYVVEITGTMPLLMHADNLEMMEEVKLWQKDPKNSDASVAGDDRTPPWLWMSYLYHDNDGNVSIPQDVFMACLRDGATQKIIKGKKTYKSLSQSGILVLSEHLEFFCRDKKLSFLEILKWKEKSFTEQADLVRDAGFRLFVKRCVVNRKRHIRVRPRFDEWSARGVIEVSADDITKPVLSEILGLSGERAGIGDWRPGCAKPGPFGQFTAEVKAA